MKEAPGGSFSNSSKLHQHPLQVINDLTSIQKTFLFESDYVLQDENCTTGMESSSIEWGQNETNATEASTDMWWGGHGEETLRHSRTVTLILIVAYILILIIGVVGNSLVVCVVLRSPRMRTVTNLFILNLAIADLLVVLFCLPPRLLSNILIRYQFIMSVSKPNVVFVLGGPGAGKGTQCANIVKAMTKNEKNNFLVDGFPRNQDNLDGWTKQMGEKVNVHFVLFLEAPEDVCVNRCLQRGQAGSGRSDDNPESLKKRVVTYNNDTMPIISHFDKLSLVRKVDAAKSAEEVFDQVKEHFKGFAES